MLLDENLGQILFDLVQAGDDLLVAAVLVGPDGGEFEAVERALAGEGFAAVGRSGTRFAERIGDADEHGHEGIVAEAVVIVEIFVAQAEAEHALLEQGDEGVFEAFGIAVVGEARGERVEQTEFGFDFAEQECSRIGGDTTAVEIGDNLAGEGLAL
jgi:hypothetical protein